MNETHFLAHLGGVPLGVHLLLVQLLRRLELTPLLHLAALTQPYEVPPFLFQAMNLLSCLENVFDLNILIIILEIFEYFI